MYIHKHQQYILDHPKEEYTIVTVLSMIHTYICSFPVECQFQYDQKYSTPTYYKYAYYATSGIKIIIKYHLLYP